MREIHSNTYDRYIQIHMLDALSRHTVKSGLTRAAGLCIFYVFSVVLMYFCEKAVRRGIACKIHHDTRVRVEHERASCF